MPGECSVLNAQQNQQIAVSQQVNTNIMLVKFDSVLKTRQMVFPKIKCLPGENTVTTEFLGSGLGLSLFHFHTLTPTLYLSPSVCVSLSHPHAQAAKQTLAHLSPPLSSRVVFLCFAPTFQPQSHAPISISSRPPPPTYPHLTHPYSHLLLCRNKVIFRAQLMV